MVQGRDCVAKHCVHQHLSAGIILCGYKAPLLTVPSLTVLAGADDAWLFVLGTHRAFLVPSEGPECLFFLIGLFTLGDVAGCGDVASFLSSMPFACCLRLRAIGTLQAMKALSVYCRSHSISLAKRMYACFVPVAKFQVSTVRLFLGLSYAPVCACGLLCISILVPDCHSPQHAP